MTIDFSGWDLGLIAAVSVQATVLAYVYDPRWKAFAMALPVPFTVAVLSVGRPIGAANALGLVDLLLYTHGVRWIRDGLGLPIVPSIVLAAAGYCLIGCGMVQVLPPTAAAFWASAVGVIALGGALYIGLPHRVERGHRTPLPVWAKLPIIVGVVLFLVAMKGALQGFMTVFPMVGVIASYEARHSLWTMGRQIPILMLTMAPMMMAARLAQPHVGLGPSLVVGWAVFLMVLVPLTRHNMARAAATAKR